MPPSITSHEVTNMTEIIQRQPAILRRKQVELRTGLSRSTIYQYIKAVDRGGSCIVAR